MVTVALTESLKMPKLTHLRRSTRHGRRCSTRIKPKKVRKKKVEVVLDLYDRDLGGYKFVCVHKNNKWHQTKRSQYQVDEEKLLCESMQKSAGTLKQGYAINDFFVEEDTGETTTVEETDELFAKAAAIDNYSSSEEEGSEEWSEEGSEEGSD